MDRSKIKYGKYIGAGLGFLFGGLWGCVIGIFLGSMYDMQREETVSKQSGRSDFIFCLTALAAAVMKADGKIMRSELNYVKEFLIRNFGVEATKKDMQTIKELCSKEIPLQEVCQQIRDLMPQAAKEQILYFLFGIAKADGIVCAPEIDLLESISNQLGIDHVTFLSIKSMYYDDIESAYQVLGIDSTANNEEIKKAYRKMAMENHPDKVGHLGEDIRKAAEEKFSKINVAYEKIKKQRGIV